MLFAFRFCQIVRISQVDSVVVVVIVGSSNTQGLSKRCEWTAFFRRIYFTDMFEW